MTHYQWTSDLETGDATIDEQHRGIFALAERLAGALDAHDEAPDVVRDAVYELSEYVIQHFADEEALMERVDYPGFVWHAALHRELTGETMAMAARYFNDEDVLPEQLAPFVARWLRDHIEREDKRLVAFAKEPKE